MVMLPCGKAIFVAFEKDVCYGHYLALLAVVIRLSTACLTENKDELGSWREVSLWEVSQSAQSLFERSPLVNRERLFCTLRWKTGEPRFHAAVAIGSWS
jgi:hypothetical protein